MKFQKPVRCSSRCLSFFSLHEFCLMQAHIIPISPFFCLWKCPYSLCLTWAAFIFELSLTDLSLCSICPGQWLPVSSAFTPCGILTVRKRLRESLVKCLWKERLALKEHWSLSLWPLVHQRVELLQGLKWLKGTQLWTEDFLCSSRFKDCFNHHSNYSDMFPYVRRSVRCQFVWNTFIAVPVCTGHFICTYRCIL